MTRAPALGAWLGLGLWPGQGLWLGLGLALSACTPSIDDGEDEGADTADSGGDTQDSGWDDGLDDIDPADLPAGDNPCREPVLAEVNWVNDGDTANFKTARGDESVRFIGVDTPEVGYDGDASECYGDEAKAFTTQLLEGQRAWLTFDAECEDYYDRTLAYVHLGTGEDDFVERALLKRGYAEVLTIEPNDSLESTFQSDEQEARANGAGLWSDCR